MRTTVIGLVLLVVGCGNETSAGPPAPAGDGTWVMHDADGCAIGLTLKGSDYSFQSLCILKGGGAGADVEMGHAAVTADEMSFSPARASCPDAEHTPWAIRYNALDGGASLAIFSDTGVLIFKRLDTAAATKNGSGGSIQFGCLFEGGGFTPSPIADL